MKFLFASDSFKGSLSSHDTARLLSEAAEKVFPGCETVSVPVADGGEGTVSAVVSACGGQIVTVGVHDPLMRKIDASYGIIDAGGGRRRAVIEMAAASGLTLVEDDLRDPLITSSFGTGELILDALDRGCRDISIAIGGSATNDGGMGCCRALGIRFLDEDGNELEGRGMDLEKAADIDISGLDPRIKGSGITVMCDVTNPLTGPDGATMVYGPQKGASEDTLKRLEAGMRSYADIVSVCKGEDGCFPGAGAAGGLGFALKVFLGGVMRSGIETVLDLIDFDRLLEGVDLVVTGEGRTDRQSCFGKVMQGVGERAARAGVTAVGLSGSAGEGYEEIFDHGISSLTLTMKEGLSLKEAMENAEQLYAEAAEKMFLGLRTEQAETLM